MEEASTTAPDETSETITNSVPVPHVLTTTRSSRSISIAGWTVTACKLPICSSSACDELAATLGIPVPELTFGQNSVEVQGPNGWKCAFNTLEALDLVDKTGSQGIKVSYSEQWNKSRWVTAKPASESDTIDRVKDSDDIKGIVKPYDWTYTTPYRGSITPCV